MNKVYLPKVWLPLLITLMGLLLPTVTLFINPSKIFYVLSLAPFIAGILYFAIQTFGRFYLKQWWPGFCALTRLAMILALIFIPAYYALTRMDSMLNQRDDFAKDLKMPTNIEVHEPARDLKPESGKNDRFQKAILQAIDQSPKTENAMITPALSSLCKLEKDNRSLLLRYLASRPEWRVFEERGNLFAARRWQIGPNWRTDLNDYYSRYDIDSSISVAGKIPPESFQTRTSIALNGKPWSPRSQSASKMPEGNQPQAVRLSIGNEQKESLSIIECENLKVEIFEQSSQSERRITNTIIQELEREFVEVSQKGLSDPESIFLSPAANQIAQLKISGERGEYEFSAWVNPGEDGTVYIKVFEVTNNTALSAKDIYQSTNEKIGWSNNPKEMYFANGLLMIHEGDWGQFYAARIELWFKPSSSAPERKLLEKVYRVEGWQR